MPSINVKSLKTVCFLLFKKKKKKRHYLGKLEQAPSLQADQAWPAQSGLEFSDHTHQSLSFDLYKGHNLLN